MEITKISTRSSRTFEVPGVSGRSKYLKVESSAEAELQTSDDPRKCYEELAEFVNKSLKYEVEKLKTKPVTNNIKKQLI